MKIDSPETIQEYLVKSNLAGKFDKPFITPLSGGVSCSVFKIILDDKKWVIKQALEKLEVAVDWFSDIERIHREHEVMEALFPLMPRGSVPKVVHVDYNNHIYLMTCAEENALTWKEHLMNGNFDETLAVKAGCLLKELHESSSRISEKNKLRFSDQTYFIQLRVDAFHRHVIQNHPSLTKEIELLIKEVTKNKECLVHGDFSPKNMLVEGNNNIVLIDYEVAHWGNPVFDVAYCTGHLMLKGLHLNKQAEAVHLIHTFIAAYNKKMNNFIPHLGLMLLARMDGKSPVPYIKDEGIKNTIRKVAISFIKGNNNDALKQIENALKSSE